MPKLIKIRKITGGVTAPNGFSAAGIHAGIKPAQELDLALIASERKGPIAGVFTKNQIQAAPVIMNKRQLKNHIGQAIVINSGNANACTGDQGMANAKEMRQIVAQQLGITPGAVFVNSTGVIGRPLPMPALRKALPRLAIQLSPSNHRKAAQAIMTTDTKSKEFACQGKIGNHLITIGGMAKGSGMIHPNMATMLGYITTDANIAPEALQHGLNEVVEQTFNCISVDGDNSTNDTVLCLANGSANNPIIQLEKPEYKTFIYLLKETCKSLALQICRDGEGITKLVTIIIEGTKNHQQAKQIGQTIATSILVKTAIFGEDPNWGRIIAAVGRAGVLFNPKHLSLQFNNVTLVQKGQYVSTQADTRAKKIMRRKELTLNIRVGNGPGYHQLWTTDLSCKYVTINASYTT
jgi:glutamate N-acetyltransferase/amino-acid N-acetyltransferase